MDSRNWAWVGKYIIVIIAALALGAILGNLALFKSATLGTPKLTASLLIGFIAQSAALALLWLLGWQAAKQMRAAGPRLTVVATILVALITLIITAIGYVVLASFFDPFISKGVKQMVDWAFILGVVAAASWFILALFAGTDDLIATVRDGMGGKKRA
jgi:eukaryotic-like serine/threonine-protein kinase